MKRQLIQKALPHIYGVAIASLISVTVWGQNSQTVDVKRGTVVYVSGQDVVVKLDDGAVKHVVVPKDFKLNIDGKDVGVDQLRPGMKLTRTITTTTTNTTVTDVKKIDAKVFEVNAPYLTVTGADGKNKRVKVPDGTHL